MYNRVPRDGDSSALMPILVVGGSSGRSGPDVRYESFHGDVGVEGSRDGVVVTPSVRPDPWAPDPRSGRDGDRSTH